MLSYLPILLFILFGILLSVIALLIGGWISPSHPYAAKSEIYECGFPTFGDARASFNTKYYRVAISFIIFDIETAFLFPWAVSLRHIGIKAFWAMLCFVSILFLGLLYEWKKGILEWT